MCMFYRYTASDGQVPNSCCPSSLPTPPPPSPSPRPSPRMKHSRRGCRHVRGLRTLPPPVARTGTACASLPSAPATVSRRPRRTRELKRYRSLFFLVFLKAGCSGEGGRGGWTGSGVSHTAPQCSDITETGSPDRTRSLGVRAGLRAPHTHAPPRSLSVLYETARSWESDPVKPLAFVLLHSRSSKRRKTLKRFFFYGAREVREYFHGPSTTRRLCKI